MERRTLTFPSPSATRRLCLALGAVALGCGGGQGGPSDCATPPDPLPARASATVAHLPAGSIRVDVCETRPRSDRLESANLYIDLSGSMRGFARTGALAQIARWTLQSMAALPAHGFTVGRQQTYVFSQREGLRAIAIDSLDSLAAASDTNLVAAMQKAAADDLALVLTDGVPFSQQDTADCGSGSGFGCMVGTLGRDLTARSGSALVLAPVIASFDGPVFLEGQDVPEGLTAQAVSENVVRMFSSPNLRRPQVKLAGPAPAKGASRLATAARLEYVGPRPLLLMILARDAGISRTLVRALGEQRALAQVGWLGEDASKYAGGSAAMTPIELLPGSLPAYGPPRATRAAGSGAIDASVSVRGAEIDVALGCKRGDQAWSRFRVSLPAAEPLACPDLISLPAARLEVSDSPVAPTGGSSGVLSLGLEPAKPGTDPKPGNDLESGMLLQCPCAASKDLDARAVLSVRMDRRSTVSDLRDGQGPAASYLALLSSAEAAAEPHKSLGLSRLVLGVADVLADGVPRPLLAVRVRAAGGPPQ
jgi:hypothetical protein